MMEAVASQSRQIQSTAAIQLGWPTDYYVVTQPFNANPELHAARNLPGHEGLDIRAPLNSHVYACAAGEVVEVHNSPDDHPYGRYVVILHQAGYRTTYGHLARVVANRGQQVKAGDQIALAGPTGETGGGHIHLTLKQDGASAGGLTHFSDDLIDPTPFLSPPPTPDASDYSWPLARCLIGRSAPQGTSWTDSDLAGIRQADIEAVKISEQTTQAQIAILKQINPAFFILSNLNLPFSGKKMAPRDWMARLRPVFKQQVDAGVSYFEIGKTPNLFSEGAYSNWLTGAEFGRWWLDAINLLKAEAPHAKFGFPAPAPGGGISGQRMDAPTFLESADEMMLSADWIGVTETLQEPSYFSTIRRYYAHQVLLITSLVKSPVLSNGVAKAPGIGAVFQL